MKKSWFKNYFDKPIDGPEHQSLRSELWIVGIFHACRYYLSMLKNIDYFERSLSELDKDVVEYVALHASPKAIVFAYRPDEFTDFALPFLKHQFNQAFKINEKLTKEEKGMILLLEHPDWTDEQIRIAVKTTEKQMKRWSWFCRARAVQSWQKDSIGK
jgi:hypothetical protein